ncbi:MAG TPA: rhomboid family intramembrane serine protease [Kofleriaceae bacterium]|jgi:membrane associated rhomboid family serine protease
MPKSFVERWIWLTLAASIIARLDGGWLVHVLALEPHAIWRGQIWRLVTWPLVELGPMGLMMTCAAIYKLGAELATMWGERRLARFVLQIVIAAAVLASIVDAIAGAHLWRSGGWAIGDVLVIAWARQYPDRPLLVLGMLRLHGRQLVRITVATTVLIAIFAGPVWFAPELAACAAAALYPRGWLRG